MCKECYRINLNKWRENNREKTREQCRKWYAENREYNVQRAMKWSFENKEKHDKWVDDWHKAHPEKSREANKKSCKKYPEKQREKCRNRRARRKAVEGNITKQEWLELINKFENKCLCCGRNDLKLAMDHIIPLDPGTHTIDNVQPLCKSCNSSKGRKIIDYRPKEARI